jgi:hypothetical protein
VFENRVLKRILGPRRDEVTGGWRKLHNQALHNFAKYNLIDQVEDAMGRACSTKWAEEECMLVIAGKARGNETTRKTKT